MTYHREREVAIAAVVEAAQLCRAVRSEVVGVDALEKGDRSPVTIADFGSQALICQRLKNAFPDDPIVGEEDSQDLQDPKNAAQLAQVIEYVSRFHPNAIPETVCGWIDEGNGNVSERFWTVDPIDGTKGFLRNDQYAIALALIENGEVKISVLGCPALPPSLGQADHEGGVLFVAVRGAGAEMASLGDDTFASIQVTEETGGPAWRFVESVEAAHGHHSLQQAVAEAIGITHPPLRLDSQVKYGAVARGDAALYLRLPSPKSPNYYEKIWDHAAGALIVEEAGGIVTDMRGQPLDFGSAPRMDRNRGVIVSNGIIHAAALAALREKE